MTGTGFEVLEHTADIGLRARGATVEEAFEQATLGLAEILDAWRPGEGGERLQIEVRDGDLGGLLVDWLNEVLYVLEVRGAALGGVRVERVGPHAVSGTLTLVPADGWLEGVGVKATTYHRLRVEQVGDGWLIEVYFDI